MLLGLLKSCAAYGRMLFSEVMVDSLRNSVLTMGALTLLASTSIWLFISSNFEGHDILRAASYSPPPTTEVVVVGIDNAGYNDFFGGRSPLNRAGLAAFFDAIAQGADQAHTIVVDLDLTPIPGETEDALDDYLHHTDAHRWLLADPSLKTAAHTSPEHHAWRQRWCNAGVRFGYPYLPTTFGQVQASQQFIGAFADRAMRTAPFSCAERAQYHAKLPAIEHQVQLQRVPAPMSPIFMRDGMVLPFQGDLEMLKAMLQSIQPKVVVVGGMWGNEDIFLTPFGERYGVHLHAAAIAGKMTHTRIAPQWTQLVMAWLVVAAIAQLLVMLQQPLQAATQPWMHAHSGHRFLLKRLWPLATIALTLAGLLLFSEASAWMLGRMGLWMPSAIMATAVVSSLLFASNEAPHVHAVTADSPHTWRSVVLQPIAQDWQAIRQAGHYAFTGKHRPTGEPTPAGLPAAPPMSRGRALVECVLATGSLATQTALPLVSLALALTQPL